MKTKFYTILAILMLRASLVSFAQTDSLQSNVIDNLFEKNKGVGIGGYGEVHYNQGLEKDKINVATADVHRLVMFLGYSFDEKTQFISEVEFEHSNELWVEQAFIQHRISKQIFLKGGLVIVPMGLLNDNHEPSLFHGVERPLVENKLNPTTWREIGFGFTGNNIPLSVKYQLYVITGLLGYDDKALITGKGFRDSRQKGSNVFVNSPALTSRIDFYGTKNTLLGASMYAGKTQSKEYSGILKDDNAAIAKADSSRVGIIMYALDGKYNSKGLELLGQMYYTNIYNTHQYNAYTANEGILNDVGNSMFGWYGLLAYNILQNSECKKDLFPFVRYELYNTQNSVIKGDTPNPKYKNTAITTGLTLKLSEGAVVKTDVQFVKNGAADTFIPTFNAGFGVVF